tara:strand:+ start:550 stop:711 length:162 start_codon:yes stop_codon:yes gene_type:complete
MYNLLEKNEGAALIFYPQVEKRSTCHFLGICLINRITNVKFNQSWVRLNNILS